MQPSKFIEDIYVEFFETVMSSQLSGPDTLPAFNFYSLLESNKPITRAQADYIIRLLTKYQPMAISAGINYTAALVDPKWKQPFRIIDQSKSIFVEMDKDSIPWMCLKFPYSLKKEFDDEIKHIDYTQEESRWDAERKLRMLSLYHFNPMVVYDFVKKHNFIIEDSFLTALGEIEEIWQQEDTVVPQFLIDKGKVVLRNAADDAAKWWDLHKTDIIENDLLLAKSMGFNFIGTPTTVAENIAASSSAKFWIKDLAKFLDLCSKLQGQIVIVLDRSSDSWNWVKQFVSELEVHSFSKSEVKVCFRLPKGQDSGFNNWIADNNLGGTVADGKILIFDHKPAKWLFKKTEDAKILVTNNLYPPTHALTRDWFNSHPCVVYLGDIKPTMLKDQSIVEL